VSRIELRVCHVSVSSCLEPNLLEAHDSLNLTADIRVSDDILLHFDYEDTER
jgi:hypothetical protein